MPLGQCTMVPLRVPPKCEATCLVHWKGVFMACAQAHGEVVVRLGPAEFVHARLEVLGGLKGLQAVEVAHLVEATVEGAFGRGAVVADNVEDERVVGILSFSSGLERCAPRGGR
jgi:hypothetical protein